MNATDGNDSKTGPVTISSRFELKLLQILKYLLGDSSDETSIISHLSERSPAPRCLSAGCVRLAERILAKGVVKELVYAGGWQSRRAIVGDDVADGRLWQRVNSDHYRLQFGPLTLRFLIWLTAEKPTDPKNPPNLQAGEVATPADELFLAIAFNKLHELQHGPIMAQLKLLRANPLAWLWHPSDFAVIDGENPAPDFLPWMRPPACHFLESIQSRLAQVWRNREWTKAQITDWPTMAQHGLAEKNAVDNFLNACEQSGRPDLALFLLEAGRSSLAVEPLTKEQWTGGLESRRPSRLSERLATERLAMVVPQAILRLRDWARSAQSVGYFDEGYRPSQYWLSTWELQGGERLAARAERLLRTLEPLAVN